jgi:hypothetical protein
MMYRLCDHNKSGLMLDSMWHVVLLEATLPKSVHVYGDEVLEYNQEYLLQKLRFRLCNGA